MTSTGYNDKAPSGYKINRVQNFDPNQMELFKQLFAHTGPDSYLSRLASGDQSTFSEIEAPALRQFNELQGGLASRFSGMGSFGGRSSSGFTNQANSAASNFAQELQSNRQMLQRQALQDLMGYSNNLLSQKPYETMLTKKQEKKGYGGLIGAGLGGLGGFLAAGPAGAFKGAQFGSLIGNQF